MRSKYLVLFIVVIIGAVLRLPNLMHFHALEFDEAIYTQVVFAMTRGHVLYGDVCIVHPPVYMYMEYLVMLISPDLWSVRFFNVLLGTATIFLIFFLSKTCYSERIALTASVIYAFYPLAIYGNKLAMVDNGLTFFSTLMVYFFANYLKKGNSEYFCLSGLFAGVSFMTKYTGLLFIAALILCAVSRSHRRNLRHLLLFIASAVAFPLAVFLMLLIAGLWPYFFEQTMNWQLIRFGMPFSEKLWFLGQLLASMSPLYVLAARTITKCVGNWRDELMVCCFLIPLVAFCFFKIVFLHYAFSLMPFISILAARSIDGYIPKMKLRLSDFLHRIPNSKSLWKGVIVLLTISIATAGLGMMFHRSLGTKWFFVEYVFARAEYHKILLQTQMAVGDYIENITNQSDKIWTTDASIAFFARRVIVAPDSEYWKFQGFFQDVWGYGWTPDDYRGPISGYPQGLITLHDILLAWEDEKPKVIVIERLSTVDYFIWHGINNTYHTEEGLAGYIQSYYELGATFYPQNIEVWIRNGNQ